ncbi:hypothetical protein QUF90_23820 [Desulfococcaceae bacterium HSG9]|nr:hypothetical protein [Desulfococcaceae bacterium HSG9]
MQAEQYVYGRVSTGLSGSGGYQVAAVSADLKNKSAILQNLQALSFYPPIGRQKTIRPRYAFAVAGQDMLSFSRTAYAKDRSGSVGYFAHHLIVSKKMVMQTGCLPLYLLRTHPFFKSEYDLPENRILDALEIEPKPPESNGDHPPDYKSGYQAILKIADELIKEDKIYIPAVITDDADDQSVLAMAEQILDCFPLSQAMQLSFCTHFTTAADNLSCYRFVTAPAIKQLPEPKEVFIHLPAASEETADIASPYIQWLRKTMPPPARIQDYLIRSEGHGQFLPDERLELINGADVMAQALPSVLESQWPGWNKDYLLEHPALFAAYYKRVTAWDISQEREQFNRDPGRVADAAMRFQDSRIRETLLRWISETIAEQNPQASEALDWTRRTHLIRELADTGRRLPLNKICHLADALANEPDYNNSLHLFVSLKVFSEYTSYYDNEAILNWLLISANIKRGGTSAQLLSILIELQRQETMTGTIDFQSITFESYRSLAHNLSFLFNQGLTLQKGTLAKLINPQYFEIAFQIILDAIDRRNLADMIVLAEEKLALNRSQRDQLIDRVEQTKNRQAAEIWLEAKTSELNGFAEEQLERLVRIQQSGYKAFLKKIVGVFAGFSSKKND